MGSCCCSDTLHDVFMKRPVTMNTLSELVVVAPASSSVAPQKKQASSKGAHRHAMGKKDAVLKTSSSSVAHVVDDGRFFCCSMLRDVYCASRRLKMARSVAERKCVTECRAVVASWVGALWVASDRLQGQQTCRRPRQDFCHLRRRAHVLPLDVIQREMRESTSRVGFEGTNGTCFRKTFSKHQCHEPRDRIVNGGSSSSRWHRSLRTRSIRSLVQLSVSSSVSSAGARAICSSHTRKSASGVQGFVSCVAGNHERKHIDSTANSSAALTRSRSIGSRLQALSISVCYLVYCIRYVGNACKCR